MQQTERWLPIKGYENYYEVSNLGNVRSVDRTIILTNGRFHHRKSKVLALQKNSHNGLLQIMLIVHKKAKLHYVHRLVAEAFVNNPYELENVTHINGDDLDNRAQNLRYVSKSLKKNKKLNLV